MLRNLKLIALQRLQREIPLQSARGFAENASKPLHLTNGASIIRVESEIIAPHSLGAAGLQVDIFRYFF